jgi:serine phosphatase RsbU (regulator of sigma subunit)/tRNA A-37 threonylcarbamoyl transferase component Bud32/tetratricopeptide (TPR) repeat protein
MSMAMTQSAPQIPGFVVTDLLGQGAMSNVFRGVREGRPYAIKMMRTDQGAHRDVDAALRFRREAAAIARLDHPGLVKVVEVGETQGQPFLVMELVEGESLERRLSRGPLSEPELLSVIRSVATGLSEVHRHGLIHRDLKPANIIMLPNGQAKVIDFGFVGTVEDKSNEAEGEVIGTFLYSAPEQSGMLKRKVDSRADIYSLGAILFECATGAPPFQARNLAELLHMHAAVRPPDAHQVNPAVRPVLALIINKLLAKDPDDRYQTCTGLLADLDNLTELESAHKFGREVVLGSRDTHLHGGFEVPLVGRATEMSALGKYWAQAREGHGNMVQMEGEGGSGKTRLIRELIRTARGEGALVLSGKAQQGERTPFGPLREALDGYLSTLNRLPQEQQAPALQKLKAAAGEFGGIVKRLSRSLEPVFLDAPDLPPLDPHNEQERFYDKVCEFFSGLARTAGPMILMIDDVQWADDGSVELLRRIAQKARDNKLLIITAARNDPQSDPARQAFVKRMGDALAECFALGPLDGTSVAELIAAHLGGKRLEPAVVEKINARARGNPFALGEYVRSLLDGGMIRPTFGSWVVDASRFHEATISNDVIQLLVNRIQGLTESTRQVLATAAVIGFEFGISLLTDAVGGKPDVVRRAMEDALRAGLVERVDVSYRFIHDRIHEAIVSSLDVSRARDLNQAVAVALEKMGDHSGPMLHALARHYARGHAEKHQDRIYETSLRAGVNALETFSNQEAVELLGRAYRAGEIIGLKGPTKAMVSELLGVACTRVGKLDAAIAHFRSSLNQAQTKDDRSRLFFLMGNALASKGRLLEARRELETALRMKNAAIPKNKFLQVLTLIRHLFGLLFIGRTGIGYGSAKGEERLRREAVSNINISLRFLAYFLNDPLLIMLMSVRELHNAQFLGTSREAAKAHAYYSAAMGIMRLAGPTHKHGKIAVGMARQLGDPETLAYCELYYAFAQDFLGEIRNAQQAVKRVLPDVLRYGNGWDQSAMVAHHALTLVAQGKSREAIDFSLNHLDVMNRGGHESLQTSVYGFLYSQLTMLGRIPDALKARDQAKRIVDVTGSSHARMHYLANSIFALHEMADYGPEFDRMVEELYKLNIHEFHNREGFLAAAYARLEQFLRAQGSEARNKARKELNRALAQATVPPPDNKAPVWGVHSLIIKAAVARSDKKYSTARKLLDQASTVANQTDSVWAKWAIARERARMAAVQNDEAGARRHAEMAISISRREGWQGRTQSVEREFSTLVRPVEQAQQVGAESIVTGPATPAPSQWFSSRTGAKVRMIEVERQMETLLQVSLATASSLDPAEQARAALDELVQLLGAERAFLFAVDHERGGLEMQAGRDAEKRDLLALSGFSSTVVNKVWTSGEPMVVSGTDEGEALGSESAVVHNLRSIMAAPLALRDKRLGVVYLDSRLAKGMFGKQHLRILQPICNFIAISLQTGRMARVEATQKALQKDMALTAAVQSLFLPKQGTHRNAAVGVAGYYRPATQCGGDWWWYEPQGEQGMRVFLGDVTGHGAASAMVTASIASAFQFLRRTATVRDTGELVQELGQHLRSTTEGAYNMTLSAVEVDGAAGKLRWWNAGSPPLFVHRLAGNIEVINLPGAPLGSGGAPPGFAETDIAKGERVLIFTDGVSELNLPNKKQLGFKKLSRMFAETLSMPADEAATTLANRLDALRKDTPQEDDITFAVMDVLNVRSQ